MLRVSNVTGIQYDDDEKLVYKIFNPAQQGKFIKHGGFILDVLSIDDKVCIIFDKQDVASIMDKWRNREPL